MNYNDPDERSAENERLAREADEYPFDDDDDDDDDDEKCGADHAGDCDIRVTKSSPWGECQNTNHDDEPSAAALDRWNNRESYFAPTAPDTYLGLNGR